MNDFNNLFEQTTIQRIRKQLLRKDWGHKLSPVKGESKVDNKTMTIVDWYVDKDKRGREQLVMQYYMTEARAPQQIYEYRVQEEVLPHIYEAMQEGIITKGTNYWIQVEMWQDGFKKPNRWNGVKVR
jgi:hypothetical protein